MGDRRSVRIGGVTSRRTPASPRPAPPAPGFLIGAAVVGVLLFAIGTVRSGAPETEPTRPTTIDATDEDFADILGVTTTTAAVAVETEPGPPLVDARPSQAVHGESLSIRATDFLIAIGSGRSTEAGAMVDAVNRPQLQNLAGFYAQFRSGLRATTCDRLASNAVSCMVVTTDPALEMIGVGRRSQRIIVSFGDEGVQSFSVPSAFSSATARLAFFLRDADPAAYIAACDLAAYDESVVLPIAIGFAATPECGSLLVDAIPAYISTMS
jgi:hypothetical protein